MNDQERAAKIQDVLRDDHRLLDEQCEKLLNVVHVDDAVLADETWTDFERTVLTHIELEEQYMLPLLEREVPGEGRVLRDEHQRLHALIAEIGIAIEIHTVREPAVEELVGLVRTHGAREEALLYRWAEKALSDEHKASIVGRIRDAHLRPQRDAA